MKTAQEVDDKPSSKPPNEEMPPQVVPVLSHEKSSFQKGPSPKVAKSQKLLPVAPAMYFSDNEYGVSVQDLNRVLGNRTRSTTTRPANTPMAFAPYGERSSKMARVRERRRAATKEGGQGKLAYMCVADSIDLEGLAKVYRELDYTCEVNGEVMHVTNVKGYGSMMAAETVARFDLFVFAYGSVVWWGTDQDSYRFVERDFLLSQSQQREARHLLKDRYQQSVLEDFPIWLTFSCLGTDDDHDILQSGMFLEAFQRDEVLLQSTQPAFKQTVSHALAQSAKLDVIEPMISDLLSQCKPLPLQISARGSADISSVKVNQLKGELFLYRMILREVLDEPDFFWDYAWFSPLYYVVREEYSIQDRVDSMEEKLNGVHEILQMLAYQFSQENASRLEWIVILLIVAAVIIGVFQLWVQVQRAMQPSSGH